VKGAVDDVLELRLEPVGSKENLRRLLSDYLRELAALAGTEPELDADGQPTYVYFDAYWVESKRMPLGFWLGGRLIGFCLLREEADAWQIAELYVHPSVRRTHVGARGVALVKRFCEATAAHRELHARVARWNRVGLAFWQSQGFRVRSADHRWVLTIASLGRTS